MDPIEFLHRHPPFDRLGAASLQRLGETLEIAFVPHGTAVLRRGGPRSAFLYVVRRGAVRLERDGQLLQVIEDGECFGFPSLIGRSEPTADAVCAEDCLLYQVPAATFDRLMEEREFAAFFLEDLGARLRRSVDLQPLPVGAELAVPVSTLPAAPPVRIAASLTAGEAARLMNDRGVTSVLVDGTPLGILTDRDLRSRVLAAGRGPDTPVSDVVTRPVRTIRGDATLFEALLFMLEHRVHHAPVETDGGIGGIITDAELLRLQIKSPLSLLRSVERLRVPEDLPRYAVDLSAMVEALHWGGLDASQIGAAVARLNDALVARLLRLAEQSLGPAPVPYAWIVFGSEGRREQALLTDQDNALVIAEGGDAHAPYFDRLAGWVVEWLVTAEFPPCAGGFMATNWRRTLPAWTALFREWVERPDPRALMDALNVFDLRPVAGTLDVASLDDVILAAGRAPLFLAQLARASMGLRPPLGAFRRIREAEGGVDLKKGGIVPIAALARLYALEGQSRVRGTLARLAAAAAAGTLSEDAAANLGEAFRFLMGLRLREQLRALRAGERPGHHVRLERLSPLERQHLKDVFQAIHQVQEATGRRHATDRLA
jgi:CBS domain-containing protein